MPDTAWTIGWSVFSFVAGALVSHQAAVFRDKRKEFNEAARPFQDWIAIHLTQNEGFEEPPGPAARLALVSRLGEDDGRHFIVLLSAIELEYKRAERRALSGRMLKERSFRAYNDLRTLQQLIKPR